MPCWSKRGLEFSSSKNSCPGSCSFAGLHLAIVLNFSRKASLSSHQNNPEATLLSNKYPFNLLIDTSPKGYPLSQVALKKE